MIIVERMKALYKQRGVWDEFSDGFQRRVGNRSRVGLALCNYGVRPGQSCCLTEPYSLALSFESWGRDDKGRVSKCSSWGRHRHSRKRTNST